MIFLAGWGILARRIGIFLVLSVLIVSARPPASTSAWPVALEAEFVGVDAVGLRILPEYDAADPGRFQTYVYRDGALITTASGPNNVRYLDTGLVKGRAYQYQAKYYERGNIDPIYILNASATPGQVRGFLYDHSVSLAGAWQLTGSLYLVNSSATIPAGAVVTTTSSFNQIMLYEQSYLDIQSASLSGFAINMHDNHLPLHDATGTISIDGATLDRVWIGSSDSYAYYGGYSIKNSTLLNSGVGENIGIPLAFENNHGSCSGHVDGSSSNDFRFRNRSTAGLALNIRDNVLPGCWMGIAWDTAPASLTSENNTFAYMSVVPASVQATRDMTGPVTIRNNVLTREIYVANLAGPLTIQGNTAEAIDLSHIEDAAPADQLVRASPAYTATRMVKDNTLTPQFSTYHISVGVRTGFVSNAAIEDNSIDCAPNAGYYGIIPSGDGNWLAGNTIENCAYGIRVSGSGNHIVSNTITSIAGGPQSARLIYMENVTSTNYLEQNALTCLPGNPGIAIDLTYVANAVVLGNNVQGCSFGLSISGSSQITATNNLVRGNLFVSNTYSVRLSGMVKNNRLTNNQFRKAPGQYNANVVFTSRPTDCGGGLPCVNTWSDSKSSGVNTVGGPFLGGNYWNDYTGADADGDRLGDTPMVAIKYDASGTNVDYLPLMPGLGQAQKSANPAAPQGVYPGQTIHYQVGLSWDGPNAANITLNDALPWPRLDYVPNSLVQGNYLSGCQYNASLHTINCTGAFPGGGLTSQVSFDAKATCDLYSYTGSGAVVNAAAVQIGSSPLSPTASTGIKVPFLLKSSSPAFVPQSALSPGQTLLLYSIPKPDETTQSLACSYDLYVVVNGDTANPIRLKNDAAGQGSRIYADFRASDPHHSAWFKPTANAAYTLQLYVMTAGQSFAPLYLADTLTIQPTSTPDLVALTDLRELFREFERFTPGQAGLDLNNNLIRDYYDVLERLRQYAADHQGVVLDVRQDGYPQDYDYSSGDSTRRLMGAYIDLNLIAKLGRLSRYPSYVAIIGDDAVLPFYRRPDLSAREYTYLRNTHGVEAVEDAHLNYMLTDIAYATFDQETASDLQPLPFMSVGRIFAFGPAALVRAFDDYERPLRLSPGSGSAFVFSIANDQNINFQDNTRPIVPVLQAGGYISSTRFITDLGEPYRLGWLDAQAGFSWLPANVALAVSNVDENRLTVINTHGTHLYAQTPTGWLSASTLWNSLVRGWVWVNDSCHSGFSTGYDNVKGDYDYYGDSLAYSALERGLTYFGSTTYGYTTGTSTLRFHDLVYRDFIANLLDPNFKTTGLAQRSAIWRYYRSYDAVGLTETDLLGLYGTALYGLPTQPIIRTASGATAYSLQPAVLPVAASQSNAGASVLATEAITIGLQVPSFRVTTDAAGYTRFEAPNGGSLTAEGNGPLLPLLTHSVYLPPGARGLTTTLISSDTVPYSGTVQLSLQQAGNRSFGTQTLPFTGTTTYPVSQFWTSVYTDGQQTQFAVSAIPLRYEPGSGQVALFRRMDFRIEYDLPASGVVINQLSINGGSPVSVQFTAFPLSATLTVSGAQPLTLSWRFEDRGANALGTGTLVFTPSVGANVLTWLDSSVGWLPGPVALHVLIKDANDTTLAAGQTTFVAQGTSLAIATDKGVYGTSDSALTLRAEIRDHTGVQLEGLAGNLAQILDGSTLPLSWQEGNGYTATVSLAGVAEGQHTLQVSLPGGWNGLASFGVDRTAPTSTLTSPARVSTPVVSLRLAGSDAVGGVDSFQVQYRVGEGGTWTDWLTRTVVHDYAQSGSDSLDVTFGPTQPVTLTRDTTYYFRVRATDRLGNQESVHTSPDAAVRYEVYQVYLPIVMKLLQ